MEAKHTAETVKAAETIYCQEAGVSHKELSNLRQLSGRPDIRIQEIAAIIDRETGLPEIIAERDSLREINSKASQAVLDTIKILEAALAKHEGKG